MKNKKVNFKKLLKFGFKKINGVYTFSSKIVSDEFTLNVYIYNNGDMKTELIENAINDLYTLHLAEGIEGNFVGRVRKEYNSVIKNIKENCYEVDIFKYDQTKSLIKYITKTYGDYPEYLWEKFPNNAVFRRADNSKWYIAILSVKYRKLGIDNDGIAEVADLRTDKNGIENLLKNPNIHPAYHMNKKSWMTIILDGSMNFEEICGYVDTSYSLTKGVKNSHMANGKSG